MLTNDVVSLEQPDPNVLRVHVDVLKGAVLKEDIIALPLVSIVEWTV